LTLGLESEGPEAIGRIAPLWYSHDPFPLTPALSLREREPRQQRVRKPQPLRVVAVRCLVLPLPEGEGRGEGERALEIADRGRFAIGSRIIAVFVLNLWKLEIRGTS